MAGELQAVEDNINLNFASILAKSDVRAENGTRLTEKIFKILPLAMKW